MTDTATGEGAVTIAKAVELLSTSRTTIYHMRKAGRLRVVPIRGRGTGARDAVRIPMSEIRRLLGDGGAA